MQEYYPIGHFLLPVAWSKLSNHISDCESNPTSGNKSPAYGTGNSPGIMLFLSSLRELLITLHRIMGFSLIRQDMKSSSVTTDHQLLSYTTEIQWRNFSSSAATNNQSKCFATKQLHGRLTANQLKPKYTQTLMISLSFTERNVRRSRLQQTLSPACGMINRRLTSMWDRAGVVCKLKQVFYLEMTLHLGMHFSMLISCVKRGQPTPIKWHMLFDLPVCL